MGVLLLLEPVHMVYYQLLFGRSLDQRSPKHDDVSRSGYLLKSIPNNLLMTDVAPELIPRRRKEEKRQS